MPTCPPLSQQMRTGSTVSIFQKLKNKYSIHPPKTVRSTESMKKAPISRLFYSQERQGQGGCKFRLVSDYLTGVGCPTGTNICRTGGGPSAILLSAEEVITSNMSPNVVSIPGVPVKRFLLNLYAPTREYRYQPPSKTREGGSRWLLKKKCVLMVKKKHSWR